MKAKLQGKKLIIEIPLQEPKPSASGKTTVIATSHGVQRSSLKVNGKTVCVTVNAFCYPEERGGVEREGSSVKQRRAASK